ncbi:MAG TPA: hypothetical protein VLC46_14465 [Thermoanaerobaculia bacterium]|nr:hypothetical protein [Thermoanaerobaculia bacterium]
MIRDSLPGSLLQVNKVDVRRQVPIDVDHRFDDRRPREGQLLFRAHVRSTFFTSIIVQA